jgi:CBS domain-containing protein
MKAMDVMVRNVLTVKPDTRIAEAIARRERHQRDACRRRSGANGGDHQ